MSNSRRILSIALFLCLSTLAPAQSSTLKADPAHPGKTHHWLSNQLFFGLGPADSPDQNSSEARWRDFLDHEVTPRFPAGLSVMEVYGQWQGQQQTTPERLRSKMLLIVYPNTPANTAGIEAIRIAWKHRTGDQSVLKVTQRANVSF